MNCFYSPNEPAVGICKSCGKGLSAAFAADLGNGLACKGICEDRVRRINAMIDSNFKVLSVSNTQLRRNAIFSVVSGILFVAIGFYMGLPEAQPLGVIFSLLGVVFAIRGLLSYTRGARYPTPPPNAESGADAISRQ